VRRQQEKARVRKKDHGRASVAAECQEISSKDRGEGSDQEKTDAEARRLGEQTGLDKSILKKKKGVLLYCEV